jgi:hypothetical protein
MMMPIFFFQDPHEIAERVAAQMGTSVLEALQMMQFFDQAAVLDFQIGNEIPKEMRN